MQLNRIHRWPLGILGTMRTLFERTWIIEIKAFLPKVERLRRDAVIAACFANIALEGHCRIVKPSKALPCATRHRQFLRNLEQPHPKNDCRRAICSRMTPQGRMQMPSCFHDIFGSGHGGTIAFALRMEKRHALSRASFMTIARVARASIGCSASPAALTSGRRATTRPPGNGAKRTGISI